MFDEDLEIGEDFERTVLSHIQKKYPKSTRAIRGKLFDIFVPEVGICIECKADTLSSQTGNVFIEAEYHGEPSGISTSKAEFWAIAFSGGWCLISKENLLDLCASGEYKSGKEDSKGYLISINDILSKSSYSHLTDDK